MNLSMTTPDLNSSYLDPEDEMCDNHEVEQFESFSIPVFFALVITLSLVGNILVLVILALYENIKSLTNIFILNLAVSDLVFTTCLPFWAIYHVHGWLFSDVVCKIVSFVFFVGFYSSVLFLTVMTIYRYIVVVHNFSDLNNRKVQTGILVSTFMWMLSIVAALPALLHMTVFDSPDEEDDSLKSCIYDSKVWQTITTFQQNVFFLVAFAVKAFCYIQILSKIKQTQYKTKNRAVKLVFSVVAVFYIGWIPYNVVIFLKMLGDHLVPPFHECLPAIYLEYAFCFSRLVAFSHCCLNPVFYAFVGGKFRSHLKSVLCRLFTRKTVNEEQPMQMQNPNSQASMY
ncbi:chemokine XC receptor 1-like [Eucyclogobius newberryi]|uniref:chemokine XC receptor 1-like n=1 Tax=Eucyclogobius newberryi TaxID=166745 RepID=UPI003B5BB71A